jgi:hypothetical protein
LIEHYDKIRGNRLPKLLKNKKLYGLRNRRRFVQGLLDGWAGKGALAL